MSPKVRQLRGRPLLTFATLIFGWGLLRVVTWQPFASPLTEDSVFDAASVTATTTAAEGRELAPAAQATVARREPDVVAEGVRPSSLSNQYRPIAPNSSLSWADLAAAPIEQERVESTDADVAMGSQLLWMAAMARLPAPAGVAAQAAARPAIPFVNETRKSSSRSWSLDAWAFWREGSPSAKLNTGRSPVYGASQVGAVLSYRLAPATKSDTRAYVRGYKALVREGESEVASGVSARPIAGVPVRAHAEVRLTRIAGQTQFRPSAFVTSEFEPLELVAGVRAEAYVQAGYVGGKGKTAFADGQILVHRDVADFDLGKVSIGGAAWAGAQDGSNRLDVGPSMRIDLGIGEVPSRLSVDWRERVAGNAEPDSGLAVTLSTRF